MSVRSACLISLPWRAAAPAVADSPTRQAAHNAVAGKRFLMTPSPPIWPARPATAPREPESYSIGSLIIPAVRDRIVRPGMQTLVNDLSRETRWGRLEVAC